MGIFSSIFSIDKKKRIQVLEEQIQNHKRIIQTIKLNMATHKSSNHPKHYQDSGRKNIATQNSLIASCKSEIIKLKGK